MVRDREAERISLYRRLAFIRWGPGRRPAHDSDGPDPRVDELRKRIRQLDEDTPETTTEGAP